jgi:hypothetical protein
MKNVKIFISSTFKDMNAERNYLNEHVLPGLKQRVLKQFGIVLLPIIERIIENGYVAS